MKFLNNVLKKNFDVKDTKGGFMVAINPNHVDLDLHCPIGWSNSQTHILHIKLHLHLPTVQLLSYHVIQLDMIYIYLSFDSHIIYYDFI